MFSFPRNLDPRRYPGGLLITAAFVVCLGFGPTPVSSVALAQPAEPEHAPAAEQAAGGEPAAQHGTEAGGEHAAAEGGHGEQPVHESPWALIARLTNFAVLAGVLVALLRSPIAGYLSDRRDQVRKELV